MPSGVTPREPSAKHSVTVVLIARANGIDTVKFIHYISLNNLSIYLQAMYMKTFKMLYLFILIGRTETIR